MSEEPMIYTTRGNVPASSLTLDVRWRVQPDGVVVCQPTYTAADGEVVRSDSYVYLPSLELTATSVQE